MSNSGTLPLFHFDDLRHVHSQQFRGAYTRKRPLDFVRSIPKINDLIQKFDLVMINITSILTDFLIDFCLDFIWLS